ncbi:CGI-121-domain-containing protein [Schizopora paradoxa]|uniref:EKC/KEOPS complex subunit CGI121 n=1 Tax=Schizopora paradoxa TaxID=27342 RepID=A0A0H2S0K7_9AGAM|nr:CGI-121-domain-containing protein [Schizopora paradoxa]
METITYNNFEAKVHLALFTSVENGKEIRERIIKASTAEGAEGDAAREAVNFAFVDAKLIASPRHLLTATYQSLLAESQESLKTKTVHSEIIWSLNPTSNITEALRRFGVNDNSSTLLVVRVVKSSENLDVEKNMKEVVQGNLVPLSELENVTDWSLISKYYKLNSEVAVTGLKNPNDTKRHKIIEELVTSFVAMKSVSS